MLHVEVFTQSAKHQFSVDGISYFLQSIDLYISCKLSLLETIYRIRHFMQTVFIGDNLHEMSNSVI